MEQERAVAGGIGLEQHAAGTNSAGFVSKAGT
jgi:hypothetical protein